MDECKNLRIRDNPSKREIEINGVRFDYDYFEFIASECIGKIFRVVKWGKDEIITVQVAEPISIETPGKN